MRAPYTPSLTLLEFDSVWGLSVQLLELKAIFPPSQPGSCPVLELESLGVSSEQSQHLYNVIEAVYLGGGQV